MNKAEATAIINAIRESVDFLMRNGISRNSNGRLDFPGPTEEEA